MPGPAFRRGDRVSLHTWEESDREFFLENRNRGSIRRPLADVRPRTEKEATELFEEQMYEKGPGLDFLVCIEDESAGETADDESVTRIGEVAIPWVNQPHGNGMLMYWATPEYQGQGYVTEASGVLLDYVFRERRLHKVWAMVIEPNKPSQAVLEKLGFVQEGSYRKDVFYDGEYVDARRYGILAEEWLDQD